LSNNIIYVKIQTLFLIRIAHRILLNFQRNPKPKLIENVTNNIRD